MRWQVIGLAAIVGILSAGAWFFWEHGNVDLTDQFAQDTAIVTDMTAANQTHDQFVEFFTDRAERFGGEYGFQLMLAVQFPFGLDTHLLAHEVGDILYQQEGIAGMALCTHDFRNACSHTMVIGALIDYGEAAFPKIREACYKAPGGKGAYTMCFHGLGHGVLAFNGYDMQKTIAMCDELGTLEYNQREAVECFGGAVMEIIGGGGHDAELWEARREEYLQPDDPTGLCKQSFVTDMYRPMCYNYMTPYMYEALGANMAHPAPEIIAEAFTFCDEIPAADIASRQACYGGHGKEFIGLVIGRDFRNESVYTDEALGAMNYLCELTTNPTGLSYCRESVVDSLYWGAENSYRPALRFCTLQATKTAADTCIQHLETLVAQYVDEPRYYQEFCQSVPEVLQAECRTNLLGGS